GSYSVRLITGGRTFTQPLTVVLDPRVKTSAVAMKQIATLSREMYDDAATLHAAYGVARTMSDHPGNASDAALKPEIDSIAPPGSRAARRGFGANQPATAPTLQSVQTALLGAAMSLQDADVAPTARQLDAIEKARAQYKAVMLRWSRMSGKR
ncbi:MAG: hypothetical protein ACRD3J_00485, partial [Thermoanaerobaculia bacterium]